MPLTRDFQDTVDARPARDPTFHVAVHARPMRRRPREQVQAAA